MYRRNAVTLVEVLIAIFVMGIGLMALLTLFPLGALRMAQAIQDTHTAHSSANATALANARSIQFDTNVVAAFSNPGAPMTNLTNTPTSASYAVFVDGIGSQAYSAPYRTWVGGVAAIGIPRRNLVGATTQGAIDRLFTYLDDYNFGADGVDGLLPLSAAVVPANAPYGARDYTYSWAYLIRKPRLSTGLVDLTVVVYRGRPSTVTLSQPREYSYGVNTGAAGSVANFYPNARYVTLQWGAGQVAPPLRAGDWFLDATQTNGIPNAYFYRAVTVTPTGNNSMDVEVNVPFRNFNQAAVGPLAGTVIVMENVVDVFEKGTTWTGQ